MGKIRVGISGWAYKEWRGIFYPAGLVQKKELRYASSLMNSIEINGTFYSLQSPASFRKWASETPSDFVFSVKGSKFITHQKKLRDVRIPLANFFASGLLLLGKKLGPILWQFPPWLQFDPDVIGDFLSLLPRSTGEAAALAASNTIRLANRAWTEVTDDIELRYAFEPRHESFFDPAFLQILKQHNCALAFADTADKFEVAEDITADFVYIRLHGNDEIYKSDYQDSALDKWAARIKTWQSGGEPGDAKKINKGKAEKSGKRDIYVYFDNSIDGHAAFDAIYLAEKIGIKNKGPVE